MVIYKKPDALAARSSRPRTTCCLHTVVTAVFLVLYAALFDNVLPFDCPCIIVKLCSTAPVTQIFVLVSGSRVGTYVCLNMKNL